MHNNTCASQLRSPAANQERLPAPGRKCSALVKIRILVSQTLSHNHIYCIEICYFAILICFNDLAEYQQIVQHNLECPTIW